MKIIKRMIIFIVIIVIAAETLIGAIPNNIYIRSKLNSNNQGNPIRVGVIFYSFDDPYVILLKQSLENIEKKNEGKVKFNFYDSKNDRAIQNQTINTLLVSGDVDLLILSLVDLVNDPKEIINLIKEKNIPVIFASKRTVKVDENIVKSYDKAYYVVPDSEQAGRLQGKMIVNLWNKNKKTIDTDKDDIMQYMILQGGVNNNETTDRTKYSIETIKDAGIKVEQLASAVCNWNEDLAREATEGLLTQYSNKIEVVIANNNAMAIGAVKALQKHGYNKGDNTKTIPVVGIDALPESLDFIKKGYMSGTVLQDPDVMAEALYEVGTHLVSNTRFDCTKEYKCDESGRIIELPFKEYMS
ncbi:MULTISPECIES: galactose ABC transporter substrate-binding protein [unclassified Clostridium]|uniref:galactose ABC transporter substrate-binding protein n=1 Tax=unclassified Clostridium TaxID=2614128 RepID=UPI0002984333|nr:MULTISPECIES: galactose ABC transporter substrate-binding protein [unclassified Clostridium]EKQ54372.1 MAG: ABC-type sugar transport system, periplasmic component [Clostridium sp. Maddingley MBC34-26]